MKSEEWGLILIAPNKPIIIYVLTIELSCVLIKTMPGNRFVFIRSYSNLKKSEFKLRFGSTLDP